MLPEKTMLRWYRRQARAIGTMAFVALTTVTLASALPHDDDCHAGACASITTHDPLGHDIGGEPPAGEHELHCVLCHWTRTVRPPTDSSRPLGQGAHVAVDRLTHPADCRRHLPSSRPPLRAPPPAQYV